MADIEYFHWDPVEILAFFVFMVGLALRGELMNHHVYFRPVDGEWTFEVENKTTGRVVFSCNHTMTCPPTCS